MGQATEDMLAGVVCQECGEWMEDMFDGSEEPGYPRTCSSCGGGEDNPLPPPKPSRDRGKRHTCTICLNRPRKERSRVNFRTEAALVDHVKMKHAPATCPECHRAFANSDFMRQHRTMKHP